MAEQHPSVANRVGDARAAAGDLGTPDLQLETRLRELFAKVAVLTAAAPPPGLVFYHLNSARGTARVTVVDGTTVTVRTVRLPRASEVSPPSHPGHHPTSQDKARSAGRPSRGVRALPPGTASKEVPMAHHKTMTIPQAALSQGHLFTANGYEYFRAGDTIFRALLRHPIGLNGLRMAAQPECPTHMEGLLRTLIPAEATV